MSGSQSDTPQQENLWSKAKSIAKSSTKPRHHGHFQAIPSEAGLSPLGPSGRDFCSETPGPAALKVQAGSRIGSLTAEPENGRCSLAQLKLQSLQHIPSNDFDLAEHRDNHSILGFESSAPFLICSASASALLSPNWHPSPTWNPWVLQLGHVDVMSVAYLRRGQKCVTPKSDDLTARMKTYVGCFVFLAGRLRVSCFAWGWKWRCFGDILRPNSRSEFTQEELSVDKPVAFPRSLWNQSVPNMQSQHVPKVMRLRQVRDADAATCPTWGSVHQWTNIAAWIRWFRWFRCRSENPSRSGCTNPKLSPCCRRKGVFWRQPEACWLAYDPQTCDN